jgi:hypothetical protein
MDWSRDRMHNEDVQQQISPLPLAQMIFGGWVQQTITVAAKLGIADLLKDGPLSHEQLAELTDSHSETMYRLMRALSSVGLFTELDNKTFAIQPIGTFLQSETPGSMRALALLFGEKWHRDSWSNLLYSVRTGKNAFQEVHGQGFFEYMAANPEAGEVFNNAMIALSNMLVPFLSRYDFSGFNRVIDVGGGYGGIMATILTQNPHLKGTVFDLPAVIEGTRQNMRSAGFEDRCDFVAGDFFESVPPGGDVYVLKHIIHDWRDDEAITILRHCRQRMHDNGKLILLEAVIEPGDAPHPSKFMDLEMIVSVVGKERTENEFKALFKESGFKLSRIIPTPTPVAIIEAVPV